MAKGLAGRTCKDIVSIHTSNLGLLIKAIVEDWDGRDTKDLVKVLTRNISSLGIRGKIASRPMGGLEYYSQHATLDVPYELGRQLFILDG